MLSFKRISYTLLISIAIAVLCCVVSLSGEETAGPKTIKSEHVTVICQSGTDISDLTRQLNIGLSEKILAGTSTRKRDSPEGELADSVETLFMEVSNIMDMHIYSLQINVEVFKDAGSLRAEYKRLFNGDLGDRKSFYVADMTKIYINAADFNAWILGHEMAHAIMARYFVVPPPVKIQEVLAGYVEYNLRKIAK